MSTFDPPSIHVGHTTWELGLAVWADFLVRPCVGVGRSFDGSRPAKRDTVGSRKVWTRCRAFETETLPGKGVDDIQLHCRIPADVADSALNFRIHLAKLV